MSSSDRSREHRSEKRSRKRNPLHLTMYLSRKSDSYPVQTTTIDLSSDGFSCVIPEPLSPGEIVEFSIVMPAHNTPNADEVMSLRGRARATRVEERRSGGFFLACCIEDFRLVRAVRQHAASIVH